MVSAIHVLLPFTTFVIVTILWFFYGNEQWLIGGNAKGFGPVIVHIGFSVSFGFVGFTLGTLVSWGF